MLKKGVLERRFQRLRKDMKYVNAVSKTQDEVFGENRSNDFHLEGFHSFMDLVWGRTDSNIFPYFIFKADGKDNPVCPICKRQILGFNLLLEGCNIKELKERIKDDLKKNKIVPVQCPAGHLLTYHIESNKLVKREKSEIDKHYEKERREGRLPSIWKK